MAAGRPGFPRTFIEFQRLFSTDEACEQYLAECRWPDGFRCPRCANEKAWALPTHRLRVRRNGTHRGVTKRHLAVYLDEFVFRHNRRLNLAAAFQTMLGLGPGTA